ncbi:hypothetical protein RRG08_061244 [Elysia crispata]|uniref:Uncharacterized protein n=1 Tax=Elysia crispata TaxID=231223 RepID=A0AAE0ZG95_9GAST|nr:hypothetical protein RRG08_061244 [Elysia crispata]
MNKWRRVSVRAVCGVGKVPGVSLSFLQQETPIVSVALATLLRAAKTIHLVCVETEDPARTGTLYPDYPD